MIHGCGVEIYLSKEANIASFAHDRPSCMQVEIERARDWVEGGGFNQKFAA